MPSYRTGTGSEHIYLIYIGCTIIDNQSCDLPSRRLLLVAWEGRSLHRGCTTIIFENLGQLLTGSPNLGT